MVRLTDMLKKAKWEDLHEHMEVVQYDGDPCPLIIKAIYEDHLIATYKCDPLFNLKFKKKGFGRPFNELYINAKPKYEQLTLL